MNRSAKAIILGAFVFSMSACYAQEKPEGKSGKQGGPPSYAELLEEMDANKDGKLSKAEIKGPLADDFEKVDTNGDGFITEKEFEKAPKPKGGQPPRK